MIRSISPGRVTILSPRKCVFDVSGNCVRHPSLALAALIHPSLALGALIALGGCDRDQPAAGETPTAITIAFTNDTSGHLEPCGCAEGQDGGIPRRGTALTEIKPDLLVDVGDMTRGHREWELLGLRYILDAMKQMGYHAANLGPREAAIPGDRLKQIVAGSPIPLIGANIIDDATGSPVARPYVVVPINGSLRVAVVGLLAVAGDDPIGAGLRVDDPQLTLSKLLPKVRSESDLIVLAAQCGETELAELARRNPELGVILGGRVAQGSTETIEVNGVRIAQITNQGKMVATMSVRVRSNGVLSGGELSGVPLDPTMPEMAALHELVEMYNRDLDRRSQAPDGPEKLQLIAEVGPRDPTLNRYAGSETCKECHESEFITWATSMHQHAIETLVERRRAGNPECLECHTVGFGAGDGFRSRTQTPALGGVGCESCHGRGAFHIGYFKLHQHRIESPLNPKLQPLGADSAAGAGCLRCHDEENSPRFDFPEYWARIKHGSPGQHANTQ